MALRAAIAPQTRESTLEDCGEMQEIGFNLYVAMLDTDPSAVVAQAYDLVVNGEECGGGTIRCHDPVIHSKIFALLGLTPEETDEKFGFLLNALRFGAPPHGGIALGVDRMVMLFTGVNIRETILFPLLKPED